ncbi:propanediol dehydratase, partial [Mycobacterium sp. ITM-2017-0098]
NAFALSNFNSEDMDDFLVLQRDWGADGGLRTVSAEHLEAVRRRGAQAVQAVYRDLGLADYDDARVEEVVFANGSRDLPAGHPKIV